MDRMLERFLRYVKVETTSVEDSTTYPSSSCQLDLAKILKGELEEIGLENVTLNEFGIVMGTVPGKVKSAPTIAWLAHMDTAPDASGKDVKPIIHENYNGEDIPLPGDPSKVILTADSKGLAELKGKTIITTDGTTLLGADDKAGVAIIMTAVSRLMADEKSKNGPIRIVFTPDEEVGRGTEKINLKEIGATAAYTVDGDSVGSIEHETFSADMATVTITGRNIHPGLANGKMVNAIRLAGQFVTRMPWHRLSPETTCDREPFLHPYSIEGGVPEVKIRILLRSFDTSDLKDQAELLRGIAATIEAEHPVAKIDVTVKKQYRNMAEALKKEPRAVSLAVEAVKAIGGDPELEIIRGGTDGSRLSEMGLPTPNLWAGMHNFHSELEYACLEEMELSARTLVELARLWGEEKQAGTR